MIFGKGPQWKPLLERMVREASIGADKSQLWAASARQVLDAGGKSRAASIKSDKARAYEDSAVMQIPGSARVMFEGPVRVTMRIFYATERPDLDESIVLDVLQAHYTKADAKGNRTLIRKGVYKNDRQVREKHIFHGIDKANPRAQIIVEAMEPQQPGLDLQVAEPLPRSIDADPF